MARPRSFDTAEVLDRALDAFWERGFEATSMADLVEATGLQKGSLYNAFGGKDELFLAVLDHYQRDVEERIGALLDDAPDAGSALAAWFDTLLESCRGAYGKRGCFAANAIAERATSSEAVRRAVTEHERRLRERLESVVRRGQDDRRFRADLDAAVVARMLWTFAMGLRLSAKRGTSKAALRAQVDLVRSLIAA
jgi:TetR/AcrR family transcriptional repressor of nem operon